MGLVAQKSENEAYVEINRDELNVCILSTVQCHQTSIILMYVHGCLWPEWDAVTRDWLVCWSMTVHIKADTPCERVSTSVRHVSAQECGQCRGTFTSHKTFLCPYNAPFNCNILASVQLCSRLGVWIVAPTKLSVMFLRCLMYKSCSSFLLVFVCKLFEKKLSDREWNAHQGSYLFRCSGCPAVLW